MLQNLYFTGVGAGFNPMRNNTNAYFILDDLLVVIDCGETVFTELYRSGLLQKYRKVCLLVTHTHADHVGSLPALVSFCHAMLKYKVQVVHPHPEKIMQLCSLMGVEKEEYQLYDSLPKGLAFQCSFVPVQHAPNMQCYGLLLHTEKSCIYYSGDAAKIPNEILTKFLQGTIQTMYQDTSLQESCHHGSLAYLCEVIPPEHRKRVYCMHLQPEAEKEILPLGFCIASEKAP